MNFESTTRGTLGRNSIASTLLANQKKKLENEVESLIAGIEVSDAKARKSTTKPAITPSATSPTSQPQNSDASAPSLEQTLLAAALEKRRIRPIPTIPPAASAPSKIELADEGASRKPAITPQPAKKVQLPAEKRWWVHNGTRAVLMNKEEMAAAYSQGILRQPNVKVRAEHETEWHPVSRFLHEFSWEAELCHPDAPPTAAQLKTRKLRGRR